MRVIRKYPASTPGTFSVAMPSGATVIGFSQDENGAPHIWATVETNNSNANKNFLMMEPESAMPTTPVKHIGIATDPNSGSPRILHLYEVLNVF